MIDERASHIEPCLRVVVGHAKRSPIDDPAVTVQSLRGPLAQGEVDHRVAEVREPTGGYVADTILSVPVHGANVDVETTARR